MSNRLGPRSRLLGAGEFARVGQWMQRSRIKSIQRGTVAAGGATAITAVVTANSVLRFLGVTNDQGATTNFDSCFAYVSLASSTSVSATRVTALGTTTVSFEVIEYWPGVIKSVQRGTIAIAAGAGSNTGAITAVNTAKAELTSLGFSTEEISGGATLLGGVCAYLSLTNGTTVSATRISAAGTAVTTLAYQVVEWF